MPTGSNLFLRNTVAALPQIREIAVLDATGDWIYSSVAETPRHNNYDRSYFIAHRDSTDPSLRISERLRSRLTGRQTIILSRRIVDLEGNFSGVLVAAIDTAYFDNFYKTFKLGPHAGITLLRRDGSGPGTLAHAPNGSRSDGVRRFQDRVGARHDRIYQDHVAVRWSFEISRF